MPKSDFLFVGTSQAWLIPFHSMSTAQPIVTEFIKLIGGNIKVPVRSEPNSKGAVLHHLRAGDIIEVKVVQSKGFYRLADDSVSLYFISTQNI